jgi:ABC-2 type transport system permease protein
MPLMNKHLFMLNVKQHYAVIVGVTGVLLMYTSIAAWMYDPTSAEAINNLLGILPDALIRAFGFDGLGTDLTGYLSNYLFGFIYIMFPMLFVLFLVSKLIGRHIDEGSMVYLLSSPHKRSVVAWTQIGFFYSGLFFLFGINLLAAIAISEVLFPGSLDIAAYALLNGLAFAVISLLASLTFFLTMIKIDYTKGVSIAASITFYFFFSNMAYKLSSQVEFLQYTTLFRLIDVDSALELSSFAWWSLGLTIAATLGILFISVTIFEKRNLII